VGIGTSAPDAALTVRSTGANGINLGEALNSSTVSSRLFFSNATAGQSAALYNNTGSLLFTTGATPGSSSGTERMRIDSAGNVGVGTSSPVGALQVLRASANPTVNLTRTTSSATTLGEALYLRLNDSFGTTGMRTEIGMGYGVPGTQTYTPAVIGYVQTEGIANTSGAIYFATRSASTDTAPTERVRIDSIGTSNFFANNPIFAATSAGANSTSANAIFIGYHSATSTTALGTSSIVITSNGNIFNTNGSYGSLSDAKLKENVVDATPKLDKLNQVRVVNYNLKGESGHETHKQIGVIAQELEQIFPGMVEESPDRDAEGNDLGTVTKSVKYSVFVPMLIKAMQEQQAIIEQLKARLDAANL
jgi:hypothetical protein